MSKYVDKFFSALPFAFILYHTISMSYSFNHFIILLKLTINYVLSMLLKRLFSHKRQTKKYKFEEWSIPDKLKFLQTHYSFPSNHAMFFAKYMILCPNVTVSIFCVIGIFSRLYYQHHNVNEVACAAFFVLMVEFLMYMVKYVF